jgi:hypothetical protein
VSPKPQNINLTFADGRVSKIDEDVHKLILEFQREIKSAKSTLPFFWDLSSRLKFSDFEITIVSRFICSLY